MNVKSKSTLEKYEKVLSFENYAKKTIDVYSCCVAEFLSSFNKDIYHISCKEAKDFIINKKYSSISQQNQFISSIKLLFEYIVGSKLTKLNIKRPRKEKRLPKVLSESEIINGINACKNLKHKAILSVLFSTGMRRSELINLKVKDIDSKNMLIHIKQGKGFKDRNVPLSDSLLVILRDYYKQYKPSFFLFEGTYGKYSGSSIANITKNHLKINPHGIRHSRGTNLINTGADITEVQKYFGHKNIKTSQVYIHISVDNLRKLHDPLKKAV